jgi:hypothetical protein
MDLGESLFGRFPVKRAVVSEATIDDHEIVAAVTGKSIVLMNVVLKVANGQTLTWKSGDGGTALSGAMVFATSDLLYSATDSEQGLLQTAPGVGLFLALAAATQVSGHISYCEV